MFSEVDAKINFNDPILIINPCEMTNPEEDYQLSTNDGSSSLHSEAKPYVTHINSQSNQSSSSILSNVMKSKYQASS